MHARIHIRDPIHGTISVNAREIQVIDHPVFQRLRNIKQLGFADLAFPGATHSRYCHSLGAMHIASRLFDHLIPAGMLPDRVRDRFRQTLRLSMLFHDIGHAPLSHSTEILMPQVNELGLPEHYVVGESERQATHEDYTIKFIVDSSLTECIVENFDPLDIQPSDIVELILGEGPKSFRFRHAGKDYAPVLRQIVSSECDADRMDYLQRDSFFSGVSYGHFDSDWLIDNVMTIEQDNAYYMGIHERAMFSFEDFLLSRYHMFSTVYLHHTPVVFEKLLRHYFEEAEDVALLPSDIEAYAKLDDIWLWGKLRESTHEWAQRLVRREPFFLLDERNEAQQSEISAAEFHTMLAERLDKEGIRHLSTRSKSQLSKYFQKDHKNPIYVVTSTEEVVPIESYTALYKRYETPVLFNRVYIEPEKRVEAKKIWRQLLAENLGLKAASKQHEPERSLRQNPNSRLHIN